MLVLAVDWGDLLFIGGFLVLPALVILTSLLSLRRQHRSAQSHQHEAVAGSTSPAADPVLEEAAPDAPDTAELPPSAARVPVRRRWGGVFIRRRGPKPIRAARRALRSRRKRPQ
ncbi:hypothetical protein HRbin26_01307 [bacterium HR26]|nr:hypothetical protein HRbin26_01307 [bacterium HR26]